MRRRGNPEQSGNREQSKNAEKAGNQPRKPQGNPLWKQWGMSVLCVAGSLALYAALMVSGEAGGPVTPDGKIARNGYGDTDRSWQVLVEGLEEEAVPLTVTVGPRRYTQEEADAVFYDIMDTMEQRIRADNASLMEVTSDLNLITRVDEAGVRLRWHSSDVELLGSSGQVKNTDNETKEVVLYVQLSDGIHTADFEVPVRLVPRQMTAREQILAGLQKEIQEREVQQQYEDSLTLPVVYEGRQLRYRGEEQSDYAAIPALGILMAFLLAARGPAETRKREKQREQELLLDYAEVVSKLMVFIGAGMTVRNAWERMVRDYEAALGQGRQKTRAAYEEMRQTYYQLVNGTPEGTAFREFGRRCRLQPYLKLSSLLEQNRRAGNKNLRAILTTEMADAFELRKNLARRMGEEAGTKLLMPLFLMLGIVMVMIMVPAMMTMG